MSFEAKAKEFLLHVKITGNKSQKSILNNIVVVQNIWKKASKKVKVRDDLQQRKNSKNQTYGRKEPFKRIEQTLFRRIMLWNNYSKYII